MEKKSLLILLLITLSIIIPANSQAQWKQTGTIKVKISALAVMGNTIFAGTSSSGVFYSTDNGTNWVGLYGGFPYGQVSGFAVIGNNIFAVTPSGPFLSTDYGTSWSNIDKQSVLGSYVISFTVIGTNLFALTSNSVYLSTNNGLSWSPINTGLEAGSFLVLTTNGTDLYARAGNSIYLSTNNGNNWTRLSGTTSSDNLYSLFVSGSTILTGGTGVFRSTDNGATWASAGLTNQYVSSFIAIPNASGGKNIFAGTKTGVFLSTDDGANWELINTGLTNINVNALAISGSSLFVGSNNGVFIFTDNGMNWTQVNFGPTGGCIRTLAAFSDGSGGQRLYAATDDAVLYYSTDNGSHWIQSGLNEYIYGLADDGTDLFAATGRGASRSTDHGLSWISASQGLTSDANSFVFLDNKVFAATEHGVYVSSNEGANWSRTSQSPESFDVTAITVCDTNLVVGCWLGAVYFDYDFWYYEIKCSSDKGVNWISPDSGFSVNYITTLLTQGKNIFAGSDHGIFRSTNCGRTWGPINSGLHSKVVNSLKVNGTSIFAGTYGGVFLSKNNGTEWKQVNTGLTDTTVTSLVMSGEYLFAGTEQRGVFRRQISELDNVVKESRSSLPNEFSLRQNYPNPFNPTTTINYSIPKSSSVSIKVYDLLGREISTLVNENKPVGNYSVQFNASKLVSGVYFYRMHAGDFVQTKKLILLK
jgi:photosystem II stability/assembly factor-like uncharacterized protein